MFWGYFNSSHLHFSSLKKFKILKKKELCALVCLGMCMCVWIGDECNCPNHPFPRKWSYGRGGGGRMSTPNLPGFTPVHNTILIGCVMERVDALLSSMDTEDLLSTEPHIFSWCMLDLFYYGPKMLFIFKSKMIVILSQSSINTNQYKETKNEMYDD